MTKKSRQLCDMCGEPMELVTIGGKKIYVCKCGERVKVREGMITAAKWSDVTFEYPSVYSGKLAHVVKIRTRRR